MVIVFVGSFSSFSDPEALLEDPLTATTRVGVGEEHEEEDPKGRLCSTVASVVLVFFGSWLRGFAEMCHAAS